MTVTGPDIHGTGSAPGPRHARGSGCSGSGSRPTGPSSTACEERRRGYQRGIEERRGGSGREGRLGGTRRHSPGGPRRRRRARRRRRPQLLLVLRGDVRDIVPGAARACRRRTRRSCVLNLQPTRTLDYEAMTAPANGSRTAPHAASRRSRAPWHAPPFPTTTVTGTLLDERPWLGTPCASGWTPRAPYTPCGRARIGFLGHTYPGMLDMYSDFTQVHAQIGRTRRGARDRRPGRPCRVGGDRRAIEREGSRDPRASSIFADAGTDPIAGRRSRPRSSTGRPASQSDSTGSSRTSSCDGTHLLLPRRRRQRRRARWARALIVGNSLLTARGVPTAGEGDLKTNIGRCSCSTGSGPAGRTPSSTRLDFDDGLHPDGPRRSRPSRDRGRDGPLLRALALYHGKRGAGPLDRDRRSDHGPVTILGLTQTARRATQAARRRRESRSPGDDLPHRQHELAASVSLESPPPSSTIGAPEGPTHHVALGVGHVAPEVRRVASLFDLPYAEVG